MKKVSINESILNMIIVVIGVTQSCVLLIRWLYNRIIGMFLSKALAAFSSCAQFVIENFRESLFPNRTLHYLSIPEDCVVFSVVHQGGPKHCKVEYLVARATEVKLSWRAALRTPCHVDYGALDIDVAAESIDPE